MISEPPPPSLFPQVQPQPAPARQSYRWVIFVLLGVLGLTFVCIAIVVALVVNNLSRLPAALGQNQTLVENFMHDGVQQDSQAAFALFSSRGQQQMPLSKIQDLFSKNNRPLFAGYQSLEVNSYNFHTGSGGSDPSTELDLPDGTFLILRGTVHYDNGVDGSFTAVLEQVDKDMMLYDVEISVPPARFRENRSG
jgi:hypothetical protein